MFHTTSCTSLHTNRWESARTLVNFSQSWSTQISFGADLASWYAACKTNSQNAICSLLIGIDETEELRIGKNRQMLWISWIPCVRKPIEEYKNAVRMKQIINFDLFQWIRFCFSWRSEHVFDFSLDSKCILRFNFMFG